MARAYGFYTGWIWGNRAIPFRVYSTMVVDIRALRSMPDFAGDERLKKIDKGVYSMTTLPLLPVRLKYAMGYFVGVSDSGYVNVRFIPTQSFSSLFFVVPEVLVLDASGASLLYDVVVDAIAYAFERLYAGRFIGIPDVKQYRWLADRMAECKRGSGVYERLLLCKPGGFRGLFKLVDDPFEFMKKLLELLDLEVWLGGAPEWLPRRRGNPRVIEAIRES